MIASTQITKNEILAFIVVLVFDDDDDDDDDDDGELFLWYG